MFQIAQNHAASPNLLKEKQQLNQDIMNLNIVQHKALLTGDDRANIVAGLQRLSAFVERTYQEKLAANSPSSENKGSENQH